MKGRLVTVLWLLPQAAWAADDGSGIELVGGVVTALVLILFGLGVAFVVVGLTNPLFRAELLEREILKVKKRIEEVAAESVSVSLSNLGVESERRVKEYEDREKRLLEERRQLEARKAQLENEFKGGSNGEEHFKELRGVLGADGRKTCSVEG